MVGIRVSEWKLTYFYIYYIYFLQKHKANINKVCKKSWFFSKKEYNV